MSSTFGAILPTTTATPTHAKNRLISDRLTILHSHVLFNLITAEFARTPVMIVPRVSHGLSTKVSVVNKRGIRTILMVRAQGPTWE